MEDQSQERNRHPLTYDYNRQGTIIVVHGRSHGVISPDCARRFDTLP